MALSNVEAFLNNPSLEQFDKCRKDELFKIAEHFQISISRQFLKKTIKKILYDHLVEIGVFQTTSENVTELDPNYSAERPCSPESAGHGSNVTDVEAKVEAKVALPPFDPSTPVSTDSKTDGRLRLRLAKLQYETQEKARTHKAELDLKLEIRRLEIEADKQVRLRQLELDAAAKAAMTSPVVSTDVLMPGQVIKPDVKSSFNQIDVSKQISLVPNFREDEVDSYFTAFERIATTLNWPKDIWTVLLQCKLSGKAQEVCATLSVEESLKYDIVKSAILRAYELVPEAYRQRFRKHKKTPQQTFVEFAREKSILFDKWCSASKTADYSTLRELILLEEFKNCLPERVVLYLNEQKVTSLSEAAVHADEFVLTHKPVFPSARPESVTVTPPACSSSSRTLAKSEIPKETRVCFYCRKIGHLINDCRALKNKNQKPKSNGFVQSAPENKEQLENTFDESYKPFVTKGSISITGKPEDQHIINILRDTGASHSIIAADALPFDEQTSAGSSILMQGIQMGIVRAPVHKIHLQCELVNDFVHVAVRPALPVKGISLILGNDIAGGKVMPVCEVLDKSPMPSFCDKLSDAFPETFLACVVTRAQQKQTDNEITLSDSFMTVDDATVSNKVTNVEKQPLTEKCAFDNQVNLNLNLTREQIILAQQKDQTLSKCFKLVVPREQLKQKQVGYFVENALLMRKWSSAMEQDDEWSTVYQVVVPSVFRQQVLVLAHDHVLSGHLGITKTYHRILKHFFWPGLKQDVARYCRTCQSCQFSGKPNQVIPPAPLNPIPILMEPFERVIVDCVGPLPKTKAGNQFLLTIMCAATRFPEAIPLRKITAPVIIKALTKFFATFGLPKVVQSDQGTNFMSNVFNEVLRSLSIQHCVSSAYHPESQGALERFHQTLKSMLRTYCLDTGNDWDEGVALMLFAVRETVQESLGFSPAELVFGHTVRGPLKVLKEQLLDSESSSKTNVTQYVSRFRERLRNACSMAQQTLKSVQGKMKKRFDVKTVVREFKPGDQVLVLLPIVGSALSARFSGPYVIDHKISNTDYVLRTPDRRRKTRVCHVNMLKAYLVRQDQIEKKEVTKPIALMNMDFDISTEADEDGLVLRNAPQQCALLQNSKILKNLSSHLTHLTETQKKDVKNLIEQFPELFHDTPTQTSVIQHDIVIHNSNPIKQHPYRVNARKRQIMKQEVEYLCENGLAAPSCSPWSSPCILVPKSDGSNRFCTDYRKVNAVTVPDCYPLPRMEDCVDNLGSARFVTKLDLLKGYWQVPLTPRASDISAFVTPDHFMQYKVMAFGLRNAPATFQRLITTVLAGVAGCNAYLDDVVIYSSEWPEHMSQLKTVFQRLANANLTLNLAKCEFAQATITYLGKRVGQGQVRPVEAKVTAIAEFPTPNTRRQLRRFLGMAGYYRGFCKNFSSVVTPLTNLLSPSRQFKWSSECQHAFESIKALLCEAPVLMAPNFEKPFKMEVDASAVGAGAVLLQEDKEGIDHPICYFSRKFNKHQLNYSTIEKEALALLLALQYFEVYVGSSSTPVVIYTDHNPLVFLSRMYNQNQRLMRWSLIIQSYNLEVRHKKGKENIVADTLSRPDTSLPCFCLLLFLIGWFTST
ncbi:uncharacterized protein [Danio rerio]|uniref:Uncharacterized protein n=1 Tax=Danio rerio TaxID=7955 RepID=A0AC58JM43_DANRE